MNCNGCPYYEEDENFSNWGKCTYSRSSVKEMAPVTGCKFYDIEE